jgi:apolipoprotein N-acyltransferase
MARALDLLDTDPWGDRVKEQRGWYYLAVSAVAIFFGLAAFIKFQNGGSSVLVSVLWASVIVAVGFVAGFVLEFRDRRRHA